MSHADITIYYWLTFFFDNKEGAKAAYAPCPTISAIVSTVLYIHTHARAHAHTAYWPHQYIRIRPQALLHERADWKHPGNPVYGLFFNAQVGAHEGAKAWEAKRPDTAI